MKQAGFGLVQLVVGLVLTATIASLAVPGFSQMIENQRREDMARQLASAIRSARAEAILRNKVVRVQAMENNWSRGWHIIVEHTASNSVLMERASNGKVPIVGNQWVRQAVRFNEMGVPTSSSGAWNSGTLSICDRSEPISHHQIVLSRVGRVTVKNGKVSEPLCR
ncbi:MAG: ral secretion pathway protein GspH [Pseudomonas sp.]|nr:ral secretion pathway protein GspH [Pseudomonas sp.]